MRAATQTNGAKTMTKQIRAILLPALFSLVALGVFAAPATAADPHPAWSLQVLATPTVFPPGLGAPESSGPSYQILATNVGGTRTNGEFTVTTELPAGVSTKSEYEPYLQYGREGNEFVVPCNVSGQVVTCVGGKPNTNIFGGVEATFVAPVHSAEVKLPVAVEAGEGQSLEATVTVEGGEAGSVTKTQTTRVSATALGFGLVEGGSGLLSTAVNLDGTTATQAGSHPGSFEIISANLNERYSPTNTVWREPQVGGGSMRDIRVDLPRGMVVNPQATPHCTEAQLEVSANDFFNGGGCPAASMIGMVYTNFSFGGPFRSAPRPLYNMVPRAGTPAEFGFSFIEGLYTHIRGFVRSGDDYGLSAITNDIPAKVPVAGIKVVFIGDPTSPLYDEIRGRCNNSFFWQQTCPAEEQLDTPFVSLPSHCGGPVTTKATVNSWQERDVFAIGTLQSADADGTPTGVEGCNRLEFNPSVEVKASTTLADSPTGVDFNLHVPQSQGVEVPATANVKDVTVSLPEGMTVNPSSADGLSGCTSAQIAIHSPDPATCPDGAKIGTAQVISPLVDHPLAGQVYLAQPFDNQFNSLLAVYITVADPRTGVVLKLPGEVQSDPKTGHLVAVFKDNPELPFSDLSVSFFNGARAPLTSPATCGIHTSNTRVTPWNTPEGADALRADSFTTTTAPGGGTCPSSEDQLPNRLNFNAGTIAPRAGAFSPFVLKIARPDGSQRMTAIDTTLPPGLTGKLAGIPYCSDAQIAAAAARSRANEGAAEKASPSCPAASEVGSVEVSAGSGPNPLYVSGHAYLAGPYKGAPLSLVVITPAIAGPFDLGNVVVRAALYVNPETAQIRAVSDPLPTVVQGIPLDIRSVALKVDRQGFTLNPTSCDPMQVAGSVTSSTGSVSSVSNPFQVGSCSALAFKPKLQISLKGGTKRAKNPALKAVLTQPAGQANIGSVSLTLPHSAFLDQSHIKTICTRVQFAQGSVPGEKCPPGSIYGKARAYTPLLDAPLAGPVILRSSSHQLPDLVVALHGQVDVVLAGRVDSVKGRLRNSFEAVPDAPVTKFVLEMDGGKKGLVVNSANLCKSTNRAVLKMRAQNGRELASEPVVANSCKKKSKKQKKQHKGKR
jgi:hypothetical protein